MMNVAKMITATAFAALISAWSISAAGATSPAQGTRDLVAAITAQKKSQTKAMSKVKAYFDYDHLVSAPIEPHKAKLNAEQLAKYTQMFRELLENAPLIASLGNGKKLEYTIGAPITVDHAVTVSLQAYDAETDMETSVAFIWAKRDATWRVVDVSLDGASMLKGYQNQFGRIIKKEGADGLLSRLEERLKKVKSQHAKAGS